MKGDPTLAPTRPLGEGRGDRRPPRALQEAPVENLPPLPRVDDAQGSFRSQQVPALHQQVVVLRAILSINRQRNSKCLNEYVGVKGLTRKRRPARGQAPPRPAEGEGETRVPQDRPKTPRVPQDRHKRIQDRSRKCHKLPKYPQEHPKRR